MPDLAPLPALEQWPGLQSMMAVETIWMAHQHAFVTSDYRFYLSRMKTAPAFGKTMPQKIWLPYDE